MGTKVTYQNKSVEMVRTAKQGDVGFNPQAGEQVIIKLADGSEKTVPKNQVAETPAE